MIKLRDKREKMQINSTLHVCCCIWQNQMRSFHLLTVEQKQSNIMKSHRALFLGVFCVQPFKFRFFCLFYWQAHNFQKRKLALIPRMGNWNLHMQGPITFGRNATCLWNFKMKQQWCSCPVPFLAGGEEHACIALGFKAAVHSSGRQGHKGGPDVMVFNWSKPKDGLWLERKVKNSAFPMSRMSQNLLNPLYWHQDGHLDLCQALAIGGSAGELSWRIAEGRPRDKLG